MSTKNLSAETSPADVTKAQLIHDFKVVVADAEALLKATAGQGGEAMASARAKVLESLETAKAKMIDAEQALLVKTKPPPKRRMNMSTCIPGSPSASPQQSEW